MQRAAGYFRVSSRRQAGERNVSLDVQRERFYSRCERDGLLPAGEYTDVVSGRRDDRREYQRLLEACRRREVDIVVVMFLDRFGRNADEIMLQYITLEKIHGVRIVCTDEAIEHRLLRYVSAWKAGEDVERIGERTRAAIVRKLQAGEHWARVPYGWRKDPESRRLVIDEAEAAVVRRMATLLVDENLGRINVARRLTAEGYRRRDGSDWTSTAVAKVMARQRNAGALTWGATGTKGNPTGERASVSLNVPGILSAETIAAVREIEARRKFISGHTVRDSPYVFAGIIRCGHCGYTLIGTKSKSPRAKHWAYFYICRGNREFGAAVCAYRYYNMARLEAAVLAVLIEQADTAAAAAAAAAPSESVATRDYAGEQRDAEREIESIRRELHETYRLYRTGAIPSEQQLRELNEALLRRRTAAEQRLAAITRDQTAAARRRDRLTALPRQVRSLLDGWDQMTPAERKTWLQQLVERVTVWRDGRIEISFRL